MATTRIVLAALTAALSLPALAFDPAAVPGNKRTTLGLYVDAAEAHAMKRKGGGAVLFVDVRTRAEVQFQGMAGSSDLHMPWQELSEFGEWDDRQGRYQMVANPGFAGAVAARAARDGLGKDAPILVMCATGRRSAGAADALAAAGFTKVYSVVDGFEGDLSQAGRRDVNGWKNAGLPWSFKLEKARVYLP